MKFAKQVGAQIRELFKSLATLKFSPKRGVETFVYVSVCVLVDQGPMWANGRAGVCEQECTRCRKDSDHTYDVKISSSNEQDRNKTRAERSAFIPPSFYDNLPNLLQPKLYG